MKNRSISKNDIKIMRRLLGDEIVREFLEFLKAKRRKERTVAVNARIKEKEYIVDVSDFKNRDLTGWVEWNEEFFDDEIFWKPKWLENLERLCELNPNSKYVVIFKGIENASESIYETLKRFDEVGELLDDEEYELPRNARFAEVELLERINEEKDEDEGCGWFDYNDYDILR